MKVTRLWQMGAVARAAADFGIEARDALVCVAKARKAESVAQAQFWLTQARQSAKNSRQAWQQLKDAEGVR